MHAPDEPMAEAPIMFLLNDSSIRASSSGSAQVWPNVARFWRALPSRISSSEITWNAMVSSPVLQAARRGPLVPMLSEAAHLPRPAAFGQVNHG